MTAPALPLVCPRCYRTFSRDTAERVARHVDLDKYGGLEVFVAEHLDALLRGHMLVIHGVRDAVGA